MGLYGYSTARMMETSVLQFVALVAFGGFETMHEARSRSRRSLSLSLTSCCVSPAGTINNTADYHLSPTCSLESFITSSINMVANTDGF